jgi:DNA repair protein RadD
VILRPYQLELGCDALSMLECVADRVVAVLPTGGGKSSVIGFAASHEPNHVWVIAHRDRLIRQLSGTLDRFDLPHGIVKAKYPFDPKQRIQVASIQTLARRHHLLPAPALIIYDECHHATAKSSKNLIAAYPKSKLLGLTATPCRLNGQGLNEVFERMVLGPTTQWLTDNDFLATARYFAPPQVADTSSIPTQAGDYALRQSEEVMDKPAVTGDAVSHYKELCDGVPLIVFCTTVTHAKNVAAEYAAAGYRAIAVDGSMKSDDSDDALNGLADGRWQVVTSCELIGEGVDVPVCGAIQILRPTQSLALHRQMLGRVLRPLEGKVAYVLDHVGNVRKHGRAIDEPSWSLEGKTKTAAKTVAALKTCLGCFTAHDPAPTCPYCGYEYPKKTRAVIESRDGKLIEIHETKEERSEALRQARSLVELIAFAKARGYAKPTYWARKVYFGRSYVGTMPRT